jgi:hypothetical protein
MPYQLRVQAQVQGNLTGSPFKSRVQPFPLSAGFRAYGIVAATCWFGDYLYLSWHDEELCLVSIRCEESPSSRPRPY